MSFSVFYEHCPSAFIYLGLQSKGFCWWIHLRFQHVTVWDYQTQGGIPTHTWRVRHLKKADAYFIKASKWWTRLLKSIARIFNWVVFSGPWWYTAVTIAANSRNPSRPRLLRMPSYLHRSTVTMTSKKLGLVVMRTAGKLIKASQLRSIQGYQRPRYRVGRRARLSPPPQKKSIAASIYSRGTKSDVDDWHYLYPPLRRLVELGGDCFALTLRVGWSM